MVRSRVSGDFTATVADVSAAAKELFSAERRLRVRDQQRRHLTNSQLWALHALHGEDAVAANQLAKSAHLNPATVTAMLDSLEQSGIVERRRDPDDRRLCMVALTPKGRAKLQKQHVIWTEAWKEALSDFSDEELAIGARTLRRIAELLDRM